LVAAPGRWADQPRRDDTDKQTLGLRSTHPMHLKSQRGLDIVDRMSSMETVLRSAACILATDSSILRFHSLQGKGNAMLFHSWSRTREYTAASKTCSTATAESRLAPKLRSMAISRPKNGILSSVGRDPKKARRRTCFRRGHVHIPQQTFFRRGHVHIPQHSG
jgi:hypothetical protein